MQADYRIEPVTSAYLDIKEKQRAYVRHTRQVSEINAHKGLVDTTHPPAINALIHYEKHRQRNRAFQVQVTADNSRTVHDIKVARDQDRIAVRVSVPERRPTAHTWATRLPECEKSFVATRSSALWSIPRPATSHSRRIYQDGGMTVVDDVKPKPELVRPSSAGGRSPRKSRPSTPLEPLEEQPHIVDTPKEEPPVKSHEEDDTLDLIADAILDAQERHEEEEEVGEKQTIAGDVISDIIDHGQSDNAPNEQREDAIHRVENQEDGDRKEEPGGREDALDGDVQTQGGDAKEEPEGLDDVIGDMLSSDEHPGGGDGKQEPEALGDVISDALKGEEHPQSADEHPEGADTKEESEGLGDGVDDAFGGTEHPAGGDEHPEDGHGKEESGPLGDGTGEALDFAEHPEGDQHPEAGDGQQESGALGDVIGDVLGVVEHPESDEHPEGGDEKEESGGLGDVIGDALGVVEHPDGGDVPKEPARVGDAVGDALDVRGPQEGGEVKDESGGLGDALGVGDSLCEPSEGAEKGPDALAVARGADDAAGERHEDEHSIAGEEDVEGGNGPLELGEANEALPDLIAGVLAAEPEPQAEEPLGDLITGSPTADAESDQPEQRAVERVADTVLDSQETVDAAAQQSAPFAALREALFGLQEQPEPERAANSGGDESTVLPDLIGGSLQSTEDEPATPFGDALFDSQEVADTDRAAEPALLPGVVGAADTASRGQLPEPDQPTESEPERAPEPAPPSDVVGGADLGSDVELPEPGQPAESEPERAPQQEPAPLAQVVGGADLGSHEQVREADQPPEPESQPALLSNVLADALFGFQEVPEPNQSAEPQFDRARELEPESAPLPDVLGGDDVALPEADQLAQPEPERAAELTPPSDVIGGADLSSDVELPEPGQPAESEPERAPQLEPAPLAEVASGADLGSHEQVREADQPPEPESQPASVSNVLSAADLGSDGELPAPDHPAEPTSERAPEPVPLRDVIGDALFGSPEVSEPDQPAEPHRERAVAPVPEPEPDVEPAPLSDLLGDGAEAPEKEGGDLAPLPDLLGGGHEQPEAAAGEVVLGDGAKELNDEVGPLPALLADGTGESEPVSVLNALEDALFGAPDEDKGEAAGDVEHEAEPEPGEVLDPDEPPLPNVVDRALPMPPDEVQIDVEPASEPEVERAVPGEPAGDVQHATLVGGELPGEPEPKQEDALIPDGGTEEAKPEQDELDVLVRDPLDRDDDQKTDVDEIAEQLGSNAETPDKAAGDDADGGDRGPPVLSDMEQAALTAELEDDDDDLSMGSDELIDQES